MENAFTNYQIVKRKGNERASVIKEIYYFYENDKQNRKKENWLRYCKWSRDNKKCNSKENQLLFKKSKFYLKELPVKVIAIKLSPFDLSTLYYIKSICFDKFQRGENVGAYLLGSIKPLTVDSQKNIINKY